jgi:putative ABC transport system substrate-binding protein
MRRREFIGLLGGAATAWPLSARGQQQARPQRLPTVGFVGFASQSVDDEAILPFRQAIGALGYIEGRTIVIEVRSARGDVARGNALISELAALPVDVFLAPGPASTRAIVRQTAIPVVAVALPATQSEPGLFSSLARPGGTLTGFSAFGEEISAKRIEMLKEMMPGLKTLGVMHNATDPTSGVWGERTMADARKQGIEPIRFGLNSVSTETVAEHFRKLSEMGGTAMIVIRDFLTSALMDDISRAGADARIAVVGEQGQFARAGTLFSYGADLSDLFRRAAGYIDRILKGEKAGDLPIQLPTKFELIVNVRTARIVGLEIPPSILIRADEVIE